MTQQRSNEEEPADRAWRLGTAYAATHLFPLLPDLYALRRAGHNDADCEWAVPVAHAEAAEIGSGDMFYAIPITVDAAVTDPTIRLADPIAAVLAGLSLQEEQE